MSLETAASRWRRLPAARRGDRVARRRARAGLAKLPEKLSSLFHEDDPRRRPITYLGSAAGVSLGSDDPEKASGFARRYPWPGPDPRSPSSGRWCTVELTDRCCHRRNEPTCGRLLVTRRRRRAAASIRHRPRSTPAWAPCSPWPRHLRRRRGDRLFMIVGLPGGESAELLTRMIADGDFSVRLWWRCDQLGALQRSFNTMAHPGAVRTAAQKEALDKELRLPAAPAGSAAARGGRAARALATHFEPAPRSVATTSTPAQRRGRWRWCRRRRGHGRPPGCGWRCSKRRCGSWWRTKPRRPRCGGSADDPRRARGHAQIATLGQLHPPSGRLHLPTPATPATGCATATSRRPCRAAARTFDERFAERGWNCGPATMNWLSDGFAESRSRRRAVRLRTDQAALAGPAATPEAVRTRLLAAVTAFCRGRPADDDRTLVVLAYRGVGVTPNSS